MISLLMRKMSLACQNQNLHLFTKNKFTVMIVQPLSHMLMKSQGILSVLVNLSLRVNLHIPIVKMNWSEALTTVRPEGLLLTVHLKIFQMFIMEKVLKLMQKHIGIGADS
jgi:hypothetical protein